MAVAKLHLSSEERKALMKASQYVYRNHKGWESDFADDLCDKLDDGGIWNPCIICVSKTPGRKVVDDSFFGLLLVLKSGQREEGPYEHTYMMIEDRLKYTESRDASGGGNKLPPFLTRTGYYGPNWRAQREKAIQRDERECSRCGMSRKAHKEKYGNDLHVHHIQPLRETGDYSKANELDNLETLCFACHQQVED